MSNYKYENEHINYSGNQWTFVAYTLQILDLPFLKNVSVFKLVSLILKQVSVFGS